MRRRRDPVPRARDAWVWLGGLALLGILGGGVTAAAVVLWENIDIRKLAPQLAGPLPPLPLPDAPSPPAVDDVAFDAVLFNSPRNETFFPDPTYYAAVLDGWRDLIQDVGGSVRDAGTAEELRALTVEEVLVLPEAPCLSAAEIDAIRAHIGVGGSVVSNWAVGARDAECAWQGWQILAELTGAEDVRELPARAALYLTVPAAVPLSAGFDPGTRIELRPDPSLALRLPGPRVYWSDWALNPAPDESGGGADVAAVARRTSEGGRTAWFGVRVGQAATPSDSLRMRRLVQNGILWAAGIAMASPAAWPGAERAALVFALNVESEPLNALKMAALLREEQLPGTFYAVSQLVQDDSELAQALTAVGEVGSHTSDHTPLAGLTRQDQRIRLRRTWIEIEAWTGHGPQGLRPFEEDFDANTLEAWQRAGGGYILARNDSRSGSPELYSVDGDTVVLLSRLIKDDYNIVEQDREELAAAFLEGTRKLHAIGGLAVVAGHTQIMMRTDAGLEALRTVADTARAQGDWWIARADEVAAWWRVKAGTTLTFVPPDPRPELGEGMDHAHVSDILVEAPAGQGIEGLWVDIILPRGTASVIPLVDGRSVDFAATEWGIRVPVGMLGAGDSRRIALIVVEDEEALPGA